MRKQAEKPVSLLRMEHGLPLFEKIQTAETAEIPKRQTHRKKRLSHDSRRPPAHIASRRVPDESWAGTLLKIAALLKVGNKREREKAKEMFISMPMRIGSKEALWKALNLMATGNDYSAFLAMMKAGMAKSSGDELIIYTRAYLNSYKCSRPEYIHPVSDTGTAIRLENARYNRKVSLADDSHYLEFIESGQTPPELKAALLAELALLNNLTFNDPAGIAFKYLREALLACRGLSIPKWYFYKPFRETILIHASRH